MNFKKITLPLLLVCLLSASMVQAQSVGINTTDPDTTAVLDVVSTTKGILIPRMTSGQRSGIADPALGLLVFDTDTESFWYHQTNGWFELTNGAFTNDSGVVRSTGNHGTDDFVFGSESLPPATSISDTLLFFDKSKGAFRSGILDNSDAWAPDSIGGFSISSGYNTIASGNLSAAFGYETKSTGQASFALGQSSQATGDDAMAVGTNTRATGIASFSTGSNSIASGAKSFATGNNVLASNQAAVATGSATQANGYASFATGNYVNADALATFALGQYNVGGGSMNEWIPTDPIFEIGMGETDTTRINAMTVLKNGDFIVGNENVPPATPIIDSLMFYDKSKGAFRSGLVYNSDAWAPDSIGRFSFSSGYNTIASGILSVALGYETRSTGLGSFAMGQSSQATADNAMSVGTNTRASGIASFATGSNSIASGAKSFATGNNTIASNQNAFASGSTTEANGYASFATGNYVNADALASFALGQYNVGGGSNNSWIATDPVLEVGIGTSDGNRKNAMTVLKNGDFIVGREDVPPAGAISDTLMFFDKSKGAFRSGSLSNSSAWGSSYIGAHSFSAGYNTLASGQYAVALGHQTEATGLNSTALGTSSKATGFFALAEGRFTKADAYASSAHGQYNVGGGTTNSWVSTDPIFEIGIGNNDMNRENAMTVLKNGDFIVGREDVPPATPITDTLMFFDKSKGAFRFGRVSNSNAWAPDSIGGLSFSAGQGTKAIGRLSAAFGSYTRSFGVGSFTLGELTQATGVLAVATGYSSIASGLASFSTGIRTKADAYSSFALGQYNVGGGSTDNWIITDPLFEVGNGTSEENRKNAMTVLKNGDFIVGREDVPPASAITDTLMFFDKSKGAFRSGALSNSAVWGANAIGSYSFSAGYNTKASGLYAIALGHQTEAIGVNSTAMGTTSKATGFFSLATGRFTHADAYASAAHGQYNVGGGTTNSWVSTDPIFEIGIGSSDMSRKNAMTVLKNGDFIVGREDVPPAGAITDTLMFFDKSKGAFRSGLLLNSNDWSPGSLGESSFASGYNTLASALATFSTGYYTIASGLYSSATGYNTLASNEAAFTTGYETEASGYASFATGFSSKAEALASSSLGQFNVGGGTNNSWILTDPIFEVGNGVSDENRQNAMTILKNGNVGIGTPTPTAPLDILSDGNSTTPQIKLTESTVNDGARIIFNNEVETDNRWTLFGLADNTHASSAFNIFYNGIGNIITAKGDGNVGIKGSPAADLHLFHGNNAGASGFRLENNVSDDWIRFYISSSSADLRLYSKSQGTSIIGAFDDITGAYTALSDQRAKMNFEDLYFNWNDFMHLKPLTYQYKTAPDGKRSIGMVAQDVQSIYPELVKYHEDADLYHLDYAGFGVIAIKAIQEQQKTIEELQEENQNLTLRLKALEEQSQKNSALEARLAAVEKMLVK